MVLRRCSGFVYRARLLPSPRLFATLPTTCGAASCNTVEYFVPESGDEASFICPISVARTSLAAPGRCGGVSRPPRGVLLPLAFVPRCAVPELGLGMALGVQPLLPSPGGSVLCADSHARPFFTSRYCLVSCLPTANWLPQYAKPLLVLLFSK